MNNLLTYIKREWEEDPWLTTATVIAALLLIIMLLLEIT